MAILRRRLSSLQRGTNTVATCRDGAPELLLFLEGFSRKGNKGPRELCFFKDDNCMRARARTPRALPGVLRQPVASAGASTHATRLWAISRSPQDSDGVRRPLAPSVVTTPAPRADQSFLRPSRALPAFSRLRGPLRQPHSSRGPELVGQILAGLVCPVPVGCCNSGLAVPVPLTPPSSLAVLIERSLIFIL